MLGDGPRCEVLGDNFFSAYWSDAITGNILDTIIIITKRKEKPARRWQARNTHLRKQVVFSRISKRTVLVDYSCQSKKKYQEPFHLLVQQQLALPVSYTALSTSPPGHAGLLATICIYVVGLLPVELNLLFYFGPPKINGNNSKLALLWSHNPEKVEKNYEDINITISFSVLRFFLFMFLWLTGLKAPTN